MLEFKPFLRDRETIYDYYYIVTANGIFLVYKLIQNTYLSYILFLRFIVSFKFYEEF